MSDHEHVRRAVLTGLTVELQRSADRIPFVVERREQDGAVWKLFVDLTQNQASSLDESLEGSAAWWAGPPSGGDRKGGGDVLSVIPEEQQINVRFATSSPPGPGGFFLVYPPRYLEALRSVWCDDKWAERCLQWLDFIVEENGCDPSRMPDPAAFKGRLRPRQAQAFRLAGWDAGFLWGPPGTGKTYTLGAMLAQYLVQFPTSRILLLSTTNSAVDQALVSVDTALAALAARSTAASETRRRCSRIGNHFVAKHYEGRQHLLPVKDERLIRRLMEVEAQRPDPSNVQAYNNWKIVIEQFRKAIREQGKEALRNARLAAMTTTRAVFTFADIRALSPFDLVVFDEASQVGVAHALALAPLGQHVLFAGDPNQLAPIVQADHPDAQKWLGESMFRYMDHSRGSESTCLLNEQSRMAEPICRIVSTAFYKGELVVAADCRNNREWERERDLAPVHPVGTSPVHLEMLEQDGTWSQNYHGPIRQPGAMFIADLVDRLVARGLPEDDIIVLTPFRAQRALIRQKLRNSGFRSVSVSTVHRSQGSERHTVIFDPTLANNEFLKRPDARRLVNVALSRAKARLIVIMSPGDRANPLFEQIANLIRPPARPAGAAVDVSVLVRLPDCSHCAVGKIVRTGSVEGRVTEVTEGGEAFMLFDFAAGLNRRISVPFLRDKYGVPSTATVVPPGGVATVVPYGQARSQADQPPQHVTNEESPLVRPPPPEIDFCILGAVAQSRIKSLIAGRVNCRVTIPTSKLDVFRAADSLRRKKSVPVLIYEADERERVNIGWPVRWVGWYCGLTQNGTTAEIEIECLTKIPDERQQRISGLERYDNRNCTPMGPALIALPEWLRAGGGHARA